MERIATLNAALRFQDPATVKVTRDGTIAIVDMCDTKTFNSMRQDFIFTLFHKLVELSYDDSVKVIILTSSTKIWCSGGNLKEMSKWTYKERSRFDTILYLKYLHRQMSKPIVGVVHGLAFGGGFELALMCDIVIATKDAKFSFKEINVGIFPGLLGTTIAKTVGRYMANKLIMTGHEITAEEAKSLKIVDSVHETKEQAKAYALTLAKIISEKSMYALIASKRAIRQSAEESGTLASDLESATFNQLLDLEGAKEGISAFISKRKADFTNK